ncbi:MAG: insulinase family protein, partial [Muribaculaceae bacterium]|nr:insulinase family protein [Muribaculaceae bacterium]
TGARDESPELTGLAHLFEHLMFGGSANVANFDSVLIAAGGVSNAWTGNDFTNFYEVAPAHNVETLFYLESDRMLRPSVSEESLEIQRSVVIEEFKEQCLNRPYGDMSHRLREAVYGPSGHPYAWPVIGKNFEHLGRVTRNDVIDWWTKNYSPANAVLAVSGNITFERTLELAEKWFAAIPARPAVPRNLPPVADLIASPPVEMTGAVPSTAVTVAWLMDRYGTMAYTAADAITDILAAGRASHFYRRLVMNPDSLFTEADASITGSEHRGMLMLNGRLKNEATDVSHAVETLRSAASFLLRQPVSEHELQRLKNRQASMFVMSNMDYISRAQTIAMAEMHDETPGSQLRRYLSLT